MAIAWIVEKMDCYPEKGGEKDVVFTVYWRCNGSEEVYSGTVYGTQAVPYDGGSSFTPYNQLTQEQVIGWVKGAMGEERVAELEANVIAQINAQKNPPAVNPPMPWA